ncbi:MAG: amidohydrolase family protein [Firmicutes bacterium]|nr:amidohydrolase family protein [Bacillota bacterium]
MAGRAMKGELEYRLPDWPVVDFHMHFPVAEDDFMRPWRESYIKRFGQKKWEMLARESNAYQDEWWLNWSFPQPEAETSDWRKQADRWAAEVERYHLHRVAFVSGGGNDLLAGAVARHPDKFVGFAHHDPFAPYAARELERAITELGFRGYKIFAPVLSRPLTDEALHPVWEVAEKHQIPVLIHFGILGGGGGIGNAVNMDPLILHDVARGFPGIPFVVPHFGTGYVRELLQLCWACRNVYVDTSGNNEWVRWMPYPLTIEDLFARFYQTIGPERIIFGSDSAWFPRGFAVRYLLDQLRAARQLRIPEADLKLIFGGNAIRLLKIA